MVWVRRKVSRREVIVVIALELMVCTLITLSSLKISEHWLDAFVSNSDGRVDQPDPLKSVSSSHNGYPQTQASSVGKYDGGYRPSQSGGDIYAGQRPIGGPDDLNASGVGGGGRQPSGFDNGPTGPGNIQFPGMWTIGEYIKKISFLKWFMSRRQ